MMEDVVYLDVKTLQQFTTEVFLTIGVPEDDARICSDVLITADLRGIASHGIQRLKPYYYDPVRAGRQAPVTQITIVKETQTTARLDAGHGMGQVAAYRGMELAINKAQEYGTGAVSVGNSSHFGIAGYYSLMAIKAGMIGMAVTNSRPFVAPTFGIEPMLGTNPIAIGAPSNEEFPFLLDGATSIVPKGKIEVHARTNTPIPEGWVINDKGEILTDSVQISEAFRKETAALLPIGGIGEILGAHKTYGLSVVVEILSAALWGGPFMRDLSDAKGHQIGHFFQAINVENFIELTIFKKITSEICRTLRTSKKAPGHDRIYTAGEKEYYMEKERRKTGIPINKSVQQDLATMNSELNLDYNFNS